MTVKWLKQNFQLNDYMADLMPITGDIRIPNTSQRLHLLHRL